MSTATVESGPSGAPKTPAWWPADRLHQAVAVLVAVQLVALVLFGAMTIKNFPLWSPVDEAGHFDNVVYVAAHGSYPVLNKTLASPGELAIRYGTYPKPAHVNPRALGFNGYDYEAFQPPLYYYVAAPVSMLSSNFHTKAILLRSFGLLLLVLAVAFFARLCRHVLKQHWLIGLAAGLLVFLMPGVIVRMTTISNLNLAIPLAIAIAGELWVVWERQAWRRLPWCGMLIGVGILTDLYLVEMVAVYVLVAGALWWRHRAPALIVATGLGGILAIAVVVPWLAFNEATYHMLTATSIAKNQQLATLNPHHVRYTIGQLPSQTLSTLAAPLMPQEWGPRVVNHVVYNYGATIFDLLVLPTGLVLALAMGKRLWRSGFWMLVAPIVVNVLLCWYVDVGQQWYAGAMVARFIYPTLGLLALFSAAYVVHRFTSLRPLVVTMGLATLYLLVVWAHLTPSINVPVVPIT